MPTVILARHGSHDELGRVLSGRSGVALNATGRAEAEALAHVLDGTPLASLHTSPRRRAIETAAPLAALRAMEAKETPALDEIDFGAFTGRAFAELDRDPDWQRWNAERDTAYCPGGETMAAATDRVVDYLASLAPEQFPALCVTHCDVIRGIVARVLGIDFGRIFRFDCDPGSHTTLDLSSNGWRVIALNVGG